MNISKQLSINRLSLCYDVLDIIKSYCFYDIQTAKTRRNKQKIVDRFLYAQVSRFRHNGYYTDNDGFDEDPDHCEHWTTSLNVVCRDRDSNFTIIREQTFQAVNCSICGGYQMSNSDVLPQKIVCYGHTVEW